MSWFDQNIAVNYPLEPTGVFPTTVIIGADLYVPAQYGRPRLRAISNSSLVFSAVISDGSTDLAFLTLASSTEGIYDITPIVPGVYGTLVLGPGLLRDYIYSDEPVLFAESTVTFYARDDAHIAVGTTESNQTVRLALNDALAYTVKTELRDFGDGPLETAVVELTLADETLLVRAVPPGLRDGNATPQAPTLRSINSVQPSVDGNINVTLVLRRNSQLQPGITATTLPGVLRWNDAGEACS